jgi:hypothetical protein
LRVPIARGSCDHRAADVAPTRDDCRALARRIAHSGNARTRTSTTSTRGAVRCGFATAREGGDASSAWSSGAGSTRAHGLTARAELPVGPLFCIVDGPTRGRPWSGAAVRGELRRLAAHAGVQRRFAPHQLRHAHALELAREGVPLNIIRANSGMPTSARPRSTCRGSTPEAIIADVRARRAPMMSASAGLRL